MAVEFSISGWSGWTLPAAREIILADAVRFSEAPDSSLIPAHMRRRLNSLGRAAAAEILRNLKPGSNVPIVYCSRHGDIERTLSILTDLANGEPLSPMNFSLSVHNAIIGIVSIQLGITQNISSIAALEDGLVPVLLEGAGLLDDEQNKVLCVLSDVPIPDIYRDQCPWPDIPFAVCFTLGNDEGLRMRLDIEDESFSPQPPVPYQKIPVPLKFVDFLASSHQSLSVPHNGVWWTVSKC